MAAASRTTVHLIDHVAGGILDATVLRQRAGVAVIEYGPGTRLAGVRDEVDPGDAYLTRGAALAAAALAGPTAETGLSALLADLRTVDALVDGRPVRAAAPAAVPAAA